MGRYHDLLSQPKQTLGPLPQDDNIVYAADPKPEMKRDHQLWLRVLTNARETDNELYQILKFCRQGGAELMVTKTSFKLMRGLWLTPEWQEIKTTMLMPVIDKLSNLFGLSRLGVVLNGEQEWPEPNNIQQEIVFND